MRVRTWNLNGWKACQTPLIEDLLREFEIIAVSETWLTPDDLPFKTISCNRPQSSGQRRNAGGVSLIAAHDNLIRELRQISTTDFQIISASAFGTTIIAAYLVPRASTVTLFDFFFHLRLFARGRSNILGDFNARHRAWDNSTNRNGLQIHAFASRADLSIYSPKSSIFISPH